MLQCISKKYDDNHSYLEYTNGFNTFNNAEYFTFDVKSETFAEIMHCVGGFTANITTRYIKENNLDARYIMLCCVPQESNRYIFRFVYLDENKNILAQEGDDNPFDYEYFRDKFKECTVESGMIYELKIVESLHELTKNFCHNPKTTCSFQVEEKEVSFSDALVVTDMFFFKDHMQDKLKEIKATKVVFRFSTTRWNGICAIGQIYHEDGSVVLKNELDEEDDAEEFSFEMTMGSMSAISNKLKFYTE